MPSRAVQRRAARRARCAVSGLEVSRAASSALRDLVAHQHGAIMLEYTILVGCVALSGCVGLIVVGVALVDSFDFVRSLILTPVP